jgi:hypothetical protein
LNLAQLPDPSPTIKALSDAGVTGGRLETIIALVVVGVLAFLTARLIYRHKDAETGNKKAEIDQGTAALTVMGNSLATLTSIASTLANNQAAFQADNRDNKVAIEDLKRTNADVVSTNLQVVGIVQDLKNTTLTGTDEIRKGFKDIVAHNERIADNYVATTHDLAEISNQSGKEIIERLDASTKSVIDSVFKAPDPIIAVLAHITEVVDRIDSNVSPDTLKAELAQLRLDFEAALKEYLEKAAQADKAQDASDTQHRNDVAQIDAQAHQIAALSPVDGEANRQIIDSAKQGELA